MQLTPWGWNHVYQLPWNFIFKTSYEEEKTVPHKIQLEKSLENFWLVLPSNCLPPVAMVALWLEHSINKKIGVKWFPLVEKEEKEIWGEPIKMIEEIKSKRMWGLHLMSPSEIHQREQFSLKTNFKLAERSLYSHNWILKKIMYRWEERPSSQDMCPWEWTQEKGDYTQVETHLGEWVGQGTDWEIPVLGSWSEEISPLTGWRIVGTNKRAVKAWTPLVSHTGLTLLLKTCWRIFSKWKRSKNI